MKEEIIKPFSNFLISESPEDTFFWTLYLFIFITTEEQIRQMSNDRPSWHLSATALVCVSFL